ncbi:cell division protein FtsQ/DivIB [Chiayiivirga flava]|uniref:Cell division protein FtsQ n=1 Tax=Chiayiivirga flava TaxID=659595 RepID=A0A7W8D9U5_9GAMM|nr:cell division protein FtsQ/DivIB [Chiayiivirga flava]MBB5208788.1 cell division protein FtsQ [Chiayiivirga flava]
MHGLARLLAWVIALSLVTLPVVAVLNGWIASDHWPLQTLRVTAQYERVSAEQIRAAASAQLGKGFFAVDLAEVRSAVASLPWVERVEVRKRWPDVLDITVAEHRAFARWDGDRLLSDHGQLFRAPGGDDLQGLPELFGPDERIAEVVAFHANALRILAGTGLQVRGARLSARGSWSLVLGNGARVMVGRSAQPQERLARLVRVLPQLLTERRPFERIDLRYTNGFAVHWAAEPGVGNGESGIDEERVATPDLTFVTPPLRGPAHAPFLIPTTPESRFPIPGSTPRPDSRFPIPGVNA